MDLNTRKITLAVAQYAESVFTESDWHTFGDLTGGGDVINSHGRLFRSLYFGDDDYPVNVREIISQVFSEHPDTLDNVVDFFDIEEWYRKEHSDKYKKVFNQSKKTTADFWKPGYMRMFISHLSSNKVRMSQLKSSLDSWGISAFVAHEDIAVTRKWRNEVELGLATMDILIAVVEKGFKESDWCSQEVGYALGRGIEVVPLRAGCDPYGFFGEYQGLQIKGKLPHEVADELALLLIKKPKYRSKVTTSLLRSLPNLDSDIKVKRIKQIDEWDCLSDSEIKTILEESSLSQFEKTSLAKIITRTGAYSANEQSEPIEDDIPF